MSWPLVNSTPIVGIRIANTLLDVKHPAKGELEAVLDTGYEGFLLVPPGLFERLLFHELRPVRRVLLLADGRTKEMTGAYGTVAYPAIDHNADGLIETGEGIEEILIGVEGLGGLLLGLDTCRRVTWIGRCEPR